MKVDEVTKDDMLGMIILGKQSGKGGLMYIGLDLGTSRAEGAS